MKPNIPLPERIRPKKLDDFFSQQHLVGESGIIKKAISNNSIQSFILWGPPGVGKTTLANIIAHSLDRPFFTLSAINSGVKAVREVFEKAKKERFFNSDTPILFIDEIHRFSKSQQDSLLGAVEQGIVILIGATTENPSFEVISPLLSRCQVYIMNEFSAEDLILLVKRAINKDLYLKNLNITIKEYDTLIKYSSGDARKLLNLLELVISSFNENDKIIIDNEIVANLLQANLIDYDKKGEKHYDIISALIKSIRGSDPNAAVYWLARMIDGGEDVKFIARRLIISAAEDIGLANPNALLLANTCFDTVVKIGFPESRIILSEVTIYLATSPKSNSAYMAINEAQQEVKNSDNLPVPLDLRNAPTKLMAQIGYGKDYKYSHAFEGNFVEQDFLPKEIKNKIFYTPQNNPQEKNILERLKKWWKTKY